MTALAMRRPMVPRAAYLLAVVALLVIALGVALVLYVGRPKLPPPFGLARNGQIVYVAKGQLYSANPDGSAPHPLTTDAAAKSGFAFSRDGTKLVYRAASTASPADDPFRYQDLVVADADGRNARVLLHDVTIGNPHWSPDGRYLAYSGPKDGTDHAFVIDADSGVVTDLGDFGSGAWTPSWSPDGTQLAVAAGSDAALWLINRDGTGAHRISQGKYDEVGGPQGETAAWSPDGKRLLFGTLTNGLNSIYVVGLDGASERLVSSYAIDGAWSPDGTMFAYLSSGVIGMNVVIANADGGRIRRLPGNYGWYAPVWSPDGTRIAIRDDKPGDANLPGPAVTVLLDVEGVAEPVVIPGVGSPDTENTSPDMSATWQRLALP